MWALEELAAIQANRDENSYFHGLEPLVYRLILTPTKLYFDACRLAQTMIDTVVKADSYLTDDHWSIEVYETKQARDDELIG